MQGQSGSVCRSPATPAPPGPPPGRSRASPKKKGKKKAKIPQKIGLPELGRFGPGVRMCFFINCPKLPKSERPPEKTTTASTKKVHNVTPAETGVAGRSFHFGRLPANLLFSDTQAKEKIAEIFCFRPLKEKSRRLIPDSRFVSVLPYTRTYETSPLRTSSRSRRLFRKTNLSATHLGYVG